MQVILIFIVFAIAVSLYGGVTKTKELFSPNSENKTKTEQSASRTNPSRQTGAEEPKLEQAPLVALETIIKYGPLEKEVIEETNKVVFGFKAEVPGEAKIESKIFFETKIEGFDEDWKKTSGSERKATLPPGVKEYTFLVRAGAEGAIDPTPAKRTFIIKTSPYFEKIKFSSLKTPSLYRTSLITLGASFSSGERINITGWKVEGKKGTTTISQGVQKYDSLNSQFKEDIYVNNGDRIYISSAASPIFNTNFRPNKCLGYMAGSREFTIPITKSCPKPDLNQLPRSLSRDCQDYIKDRASCEELNYDHLEEFDLSKDSICISYVEMNYNYPGCFRNYSQDQNFLKKEWHIYTNIASPEKEIMDWRGDTLYLRDGNNLFVDKYEY